MFFFFFSHILLFLTAKLNETRTAAISSDICNIQVTHVVISCTEENSPYKTFNIFPPAYTEFFLVDSSQRQLITATSPNNCSKSQTAPQSLC